MVWSQVDRARRAGSARGVDAIHNAADAGDLGCKLFRRLPGGERIDGPRQMDKAVQDAHPYLDCSQAAICGERSKNRGP